MDTTDHKLYQFLRAARGNWHNTIFIRCFHKACPYRHSGCPSTFLLAVDAEGQPLLMPAESLERMTGEQIEENECQAVLSLKTFEAVYGAYLEWHTDCSKDCACLQLSLYDS